MVYQPTKEEDCFCVEENLRTQQPKSLLERSMFFLHGNQDFMESTPISPEEPIVKEWYGTLPSCSPFKHMLRLAKLTGWEGKDSQGKPIIPFKLKDMSHELHCLYHMKRDSRRLHLLFRMQIGAPQRIAIQLGEKIADEMKKLSSHQGHLLLRPSLESYKGDRWGDFVSLHLEDMLNKKEKRS